MSSDASVLLGALLDRLGKVQGNALLARLDQWLTREGEGRSVHKGIDSDRLHALAKPYDRRRLRQERN